MRVKSAALRNTNINRRNGNRSPKTFDLVQATKHPEFMQTLNKFIDSLAQNLTAICRSVAPQLTALVTTFSIRAGERFLAGGH